MRIGAHVGVSDGYAEAVAYALEVGCECIQVFAKSPRMWAGPRVDIAAASAFAVAREGVGIFPCVTHAAYLINLGSTDDAMWEKSVLALTDEVLRAALLGAAGVVVHMGTARDGPEAAAERVADGVARAWNVAAAALRADAPAVLLENAAGAGRSFGRSVAEIGSAVSAVRSRGVDAVGVCIDTCHAFAAGIDLRDGQAWAAFADAFDTEIGLDRLRVVHANDCAGALGEHKDRHAWIGEGSIGEAGFTAMFAESRIANAAAILEMPGDKPEKDAENIARLRRLRGSVEAP